MNVNSQNYVCFKEVDPSNSVAAFSKRCICLNKCFYYFVNVLFEMDEITKIKGVDIYY